MFDQTKRYNLISRNKTLVPFHLANVDWIDPKTSLYKMIKIDHIQTKFLSATLKAIADFIMIKSRFISRTKIDIGEFADAMAELLSIFVDRSLPFGYLLARLYDQVLAGKSPTIKHCKRGICLSNTVSSLTNGHIKELSGLKGPWQKHREYNDSIYPYGPQILAQLLDKQEKLWCFKGKESWTWCAMRDSATGESLKWTHCQNIAAATEILEPVNTYIIEGSPMRSILFEQDLLDIYRCWPSYRNETILHSATWLWSWTNRTVVINCEPQRVDDFYLNYHIPDGFEIHVANPIFDDFVEQDRRPDPMIDLMPRDYRAVHRAKEIETESRFNLFSCCM